MDTLTASKVTAFKNAPSAAKRLCATQAGGGSLPILNTRAAIERDASKAAQRNKR